MRLTTFRPTLQLAVTAALLTISASPLLAEQYETLITQIRDRAYGHVHSIQTVRCRATMNYSAGGRAIVSYFRCGNRYRIERDDVKPSIIDGESFSTPFHLWTYDGERYQMFNKDKKAMAITSWKGGVGCTDPMTVSFEWMAHLRCQHADRKLLESFDTWKQVFSMGKVCERGVWRGKECEILEFEQQCTDPVATFRVYFLIEENYLPVRCERWLLHGEQWESVSEVEQFTSIVKDDQSFVIVQHYSYQDPFVEKHTRIDLESIVLNEPIDDAMFRIDPSIAESVYDVESNFNAFEESKKNHEEMTSVAVPKPKGQRIAVVANLIFVGLVIVAIWWKKGERSCSA